MASTDETIKFLDRVGHWIERTSLFRFVPLPGTYVFNNAKQLNIRGLPGSADWDGDWGRFHIHHNHHHWWGSVRDFDALTDAFWKLWDYVESRWPSKYAPEELPLDQWADQRSLLRKSVAN